MAITYSTMTFSTPKELVEFLMLCEANPQVSQLDIVKRMMGSGNLTIEADPNIPFEDFVNTDAFMSSMGATSPSYHRSGDSSYKAKRRRTRADGPPLTEQIKALVEDYIHAQNEFSAMDIYSEIAKNDPGVNKQSVISSVQKLMEGPYANVPRDFRQGRGPRPKKVYIPQRSEATQVS